MPVWCPKCRAMLPEGAEKCPACGTQMKDPARAGFGRSEYFWVSLYVIGIALIPITIIVALSFACVFLTQ